MTIRFFINRIMKIHVFDYQSGLRSVYVLFLPIREAAIHNRYLTEQNVYIGLLVTIESRISDQDIFTVLE